MDNSIYRIKSRAACLGLKHVEIIRMIHERGIYITPTNFSQMISGYDRGDRARKVTAMTDEILTALEKAQKE